MCRERMAHDTIKVLKLFYGSYNDSFPRFLDPTQLPSGLAYAVIFHINIHVISPHHSISFAFDQLYALPELHVTLNKVTTIFGTTNSPLHFSPSLMMLYIAWYSLQAIIKRRPTVVTEWLAIVPGRIIRAFQIMMIQKLGIYVVKWRLVKKFLKWNFL